MDVPIWAVDMNLQDWHQIGWISNYIPENMGIIAYPYPDLN